MTPFGVGFYVCFIFPAESTNKYVALVLNIEQSSPCKKMGEHFQGTVHAPIYDFFNSLYKPQHL